MVVSSNDAEMFSVKSFFICRINEEIIRFEKEVKRCEEFVEKVKENHP